MEFPIILQIIGYQNSGKTTVITSLLEHLSNMGIRSGVIKHHGHDSSLSFNDPGKDTDRHRKAGAFVTSVSSAANTIISMDHSLSLENTIEMYKLLDIDCILIEGYKQIQHPRVVLCRNNEDRTLIESSLDPVVIIGETNLHEKYQFPFFLYEDQTHWLPFLMEYIKKEMRRGNGSKS